VFLPPQLSHQGTSCPVHEATRRPDQEATGRPDQEATGKPDQEATGKPDQEATGKTDQEATGRPDQEATGRPDQGAIGLFDQEATGRFEQKAAERPDHRPPHQPLPCPSRESLKHCIGFSPVIYHRYQILLCSQFKEIAARDFQPVFFFHVSTPYGPLSHNLKYLFSKTVSNLQVVPPGLILCRNLFKRGLRLFGNLSRTPQKISEESDTLRRFVKRGPAEICRKSDTRKSFIQIC
jgi:hypothetical protein